MTTPPHVVHAILVTRDGGQLMVGGDMLAGMEKPALGALFVAQTVPSGPYLPQICTRAMGTPAAYLQALAEFMVSEPGMLEAFMGLCAFVKLQRDKINAQSGPPPGRPA